MDLEWNEEQEMLREMVRGVCAEYAPVDLVRSLEDDPTGYPADLWKQLGELDLLGITIPEAFGGSEQGMLEAAIVYEEFGRSLAPTPHFVSCVLSAGVILRDGSKEQKREWLPRIASGDAILTPAWLEPKSGYGPAGIQLRAERDGDDYVLSGTKLHALFAHSAVRLVVPVRTGEGTTEIALLLVDPMSVQYLFDAEIDYKEDLQGATFVIRNPNAATTCGCGSSFAV